MAYRDQEYIKHLINCCELLAKQIVGEQCQRCGRPDCEMRSRFDTCVEEVHDVIPWRIQPEIKSEFSNPESIQKFTAEEAWHGLTGE